MVQRRPGQRIQRNARRDRSHGGRGELVDCHFALLCRHIADFGDLKAKGNAIRIPAISTFRVENGKLAEGWELFDSGDMARQMQA
jgi:predicted ester cyclase